jgi:cytochrome c biogenesis protein CcmG, thiol:disulfide interchange protein DsbE
VSSSNNRGSARPPRAAVRPPKGGPERGWRVAPVLWIAGAVVVALAVVAVVVATGESDERPSGQRETAAVAVDGTALPDFSGTGTDAAVGKRAPTLSGVAFDGTARALRPGGKPKVVLFVAHWCPHCQREVPQIRDWVNTKGLPEGVELLTVVTGTLENRPNYPPSGWLARERWPLPVLLDDEGGSAARAYGLTGYPFFTFVKADGTVAARATGEVAIAQLEAQINALG